MWFLIKGTFWFSMVLVALSYFNGQQPGEEAKGPQLEIGSAIAAATGAYDYVSGLCMEKPDVCVKGVETFNALGLRAREGAFVAYQMLGKQFADAPGENQALAETDESRPGAASDVIVTGTVMPTIPTPRPKPVL
ncbi:DUF5330 domain-containing protein [Agrobacterium sp. a22-2]|uniref:DUF5330 domain-containing protein n=1 Tax=Agrobacterium sp. a22-2 TaxID=2283840 RepID=UPI001448739A|nr:DUF5330 domain-containing protein [Agrobacterium sp. a22-2]NKN39529.1 DUF5330 domain-containing protein [Agrobacterium sp. a22-2]